LAAPLEELTHRRQRFPRTPSWTCLAGAETREGGRGKRQKGVDSWGMGTEEGGRGQEGRRDGREWEENGCRNLAGASKCTPCDTKCVTEILGKGGGKNKEFGGGTEFKFGQLIIRKIIKIVAARCHILRLKCTKFEFIWGSTPDPARQCWKKSQLKK